MLKKSNLVYKKIIINQNNIKKLEPNIKKLFPKDYIFKLKINNKMGGGQRGIYIYLKIKFCPKLSAARLVLVLREAVSNFFRDLSYCPAS